MNDDGEYFYVLESRVAKKELNAVLASTGWAFIGLGLGNIVLALGLARLLSRRLVVRIEKAARLINGMTKSGDFTKRINMVGNDEVAQLTNAFDDLLDDLDEAKEKVSRFFVKLRSVS